MPPHDFSKSNLRKHRDHSQHVICRACVKNPTPAIDPFTQDDVPLSRVPSALQQICGTTCSGGSQPTLPDAPQPTALATEPGTCQGTGRGGYAHAKDATLGRLTYSCCEDPPTCPLCWTREEGHHPPDHPIGPPTDEACNTTSAEWLLLAIKTQPLAHHDCGLVTTYIAMDPTFHLPT